MTEMAILQEVDKCIRCNGCVVACKREWKMKQETIGVMKVAYDQRLAIKSQKSVDMGPFLRFSCWHCPDPPCAKRCPKQAITKLADGAVDVDFEKCDPNYCSGLDPFGRYPCQVECQRGGYPKIGEGSDMAFVHPGPKAYKCTLCSTRAGVTDTTVPFQNAPTSTHYANGYKSALVFPGSDNTTVIDELRHAPTCVMTCPAKAMVWDTKANIVRYLRANYIQADGSQGWMGDGSMYWASKKVLIAPPKADPYVEDHLNPLTSSVLSGPIAKAAIVPTILVGGLMALSARRAANEERTATEGEVA